MSMVVLDRSVSRESVGSASTPRTPIKTKQTSLVDLFELSTVKQPREAIASQEIPHKELRSK